MKKLLLVLAIGAFAACNDSATSTETTVDSTSVTVDTTMQSTTGDSLSTGADTTTGARVDSVQATPAH
jgi:hypothetical protein